MKLQATADLIKITPEIASEWLADRWGEQRNIRPAQVARLASDMLAGRFKLGPDAILRIKGKIANGQHRLAAVVESGKPQVFLVMESNDEELYKVIDAGMRRSVSDGLIGMPYARSIPSIARWVQVYDSSNTTSPSRARYSTGLTQSQQIDFCLSNLEVLQAAAAFVNPLYEKTMLLPASIGGAIYAISAARDGTLEKSKEFIRRVYLDGGDNAAGDLRNRLIANRGSKSRLHSGYLFGITIKALKAFCNGTRPGVLKWAKDEPMPSL